MSYGCHFLNADTCLFVEPAPPIKHHSCDAPFIGKSSGNFVNVMLHSLLPGNYSQKKANNQLFLLYVILFFYR